MIVRLKHKSWVSHAAFSPDGTRVVTSSWDGTAKVWDVNGQPISPPLTHQNGLDHVSFSPDGRYVVTASWDKTSRVWDATSGVPVTPFLLHGGRVVSASFSPDGRRLITVSQDVARLWEMSRSVPNTPVCTQAIDIVSSWYSSDVQRIVTVSRDNSANIWDAVSGKAIFAIQPTNSSEFREIVFSPDCKRAATLLSDKTLQFWDLTHAQSIASPFVHRDVLSIGKFSEDSQRLIISKRDKKDNSSVHILDTTTGQSLSAPISNNLKVEDTALSPDGLQMVTVSDNAVRIWNVSTGKHVPLQTEFYDFVDQISYSPNGQFFFIVAGNKVLIYNAANGQKLVLAHQNIVNHASWGKDSTQIVTASRDTRARIWDAVSGKALSPPLEHLGEVRHATFSPDNSKVLTTCGDYVRVWDAESGQPLTPPLVHGQVVKSAFFGPDGDRIVTTSGGKVQIWHLTSDVRQVKDLLSLAQVYSSHKIDNSGDLFPLLIQNELYPLFKKMKLSFPEEFEPSATDFRNWRLDQIANSCKERNLPAALFHQNWLLAEAVLEAAKSSSQQKPQK